MLRHACGNIHAVGSSFLPLILLTCVGLPVGRAVRAGVTTDEIDRIVYEACIERYASFLPYPALSRQDTGPGTHSTANLWLTLAVCLCPCGV